MGALDLFSPATRAWFEASFPAPTPAQEQGWAAIAGGAHTLIHAPTGSGKTLAAFLYALDRLSQEPLPDDAVRCRVLYVSPLKALAYDIDRNLRAPLVGMRHAATRLGLQLPGITTAMRTGDTPQSERRSMLRTPPDVLITTPESLYLMLTSSAREILAPVRWVIVDEIHAVAASKRGSHLSLSLERLEAVTDAPQRIGLSATQRPLEDIARFLGGGVASGDSWEARPVEIVDAPRDKELDIEIVVPVEDMTNPVEGDDPDEPSRRSIWPAMYPELLEQVMEHRSTIVFCNSRGLVERLAAELNELAGKEIARAHHGSVSREQRIAIEDGLKSGELRCVVATSSLELGIDMDAVDLVLLVESPTSVARGLQRVGRAGHQVGAASRARVYPKHRGDLLEAALVVDRMYDGLIEETRIPVNALDVLAQQVVAMVAVGDQEVDALYDTVRGAHPYRDLGRGPFEAVLDMLAGRYPSDDFAELRPRLVWDRVGGTLTALPNARILAVTNPGTIPDRGLYRVVLPDGGRVGELDEEMVYESRVGDVFVLGSSTWRISEITEDRVVVVPAPGEPAARMPFWKGDTLGRPLETGRALGAFVRTLGDLDTAAAAERLEGEYRLERRAARNLAAFLAEEREATGALPTDRSITVEVFRDEIGDWRLVVLSPFGARIHAPWALAAARRIRQETGAEVDAVWSDDGVILRLPEADERPDPSLVILEPDEVEALVVDEVGSSAIFAARFREAAGRALLLPRRRPGTRTPLWLQRRRSTSLLDAARRFPSFPIVLEAYREVLQQHFDMPALAEVLGEIRGRRIRVHTVETSGPSPFAQSLMFDFIASFMYEYDAPLAERQALALTVDQGLLRELLGEPELRDLLDPEVVAVVEAELQRLAPERRVAGVDGVADLLRAVGPLDPDGVSMRMRDPEAAPAVIDTLIDARRAIEVTVRGDTLVAAVEDAGRLRDAIGAQPPQGVPAAFLEPVEDPLGDVVGRYARTHGPFTTDEASAALAIPPAAVRTALEALERRGRVVRGAFRPGGAGREWVETDVLRHLRRRSLAVLRREVEAAEPSVLARFLPEWHGVGDGGSGPGRLMDVIGRLQGAAIPASILETDVLPGRLDHTPDQLDALTAGGEVVWLGRGALGSRDGRIALYRRDRVPELAWDPGLEPPEGALHDAIRTRLIERGASFFRDLYDAAGGGDPDEVLGALWDLVWAGEITNDTFAPVRAHLWGRVRKARSRRPSLPGAAAPPAASGRWYLAADLMADATPTAALAARAGQMLERHGVVVRDAVLSEGVPGGFAGLYPVLTAMEEAGRVRRGYFVEGRGGAQFALPGAVDLLRAAANGTSLVTLGAADPANPYGAALPWPESAGGRASRSAGAYVVLVDGRLVAFVERGGRTVATFSDDAGDVASAAAAIRRLGETRIPRMTVATIDGVSASDTPLGRALQQGGFARSYKGLALR